MTLEPGIQNLSDLIDYQTGAVHDSSRSPAPGR
jgi:hypothetical protein